jgi:hypothetical protein
MSVGMLHCEEPVLVCVVDCAWGVASPNRFSRSGSADRCRNEDAGVVVMGCGSWYRIVSGLERSAFKSAVAFVVVRHGNSRNVIGIWRRYEPQV